MSSSSSSNMDDSRLIPISLQTSKALYPNAAYTQIYHDTTSKELISAIREIPALRNERSDHLVIILLDSNDDSLSSLFISPGSQSAVSLFPTNQLFVITYSILVFTDLNTFFQTIAEVRERVQADPTVPVNSKQRMNYLVDNLNEILIQYYQFAINYL